MSDDSCEKHIESVHDPDLALQGLARQQSRGVAFLDALTVSVSRFEQPAKANPIELIIFKPEQLTD